MIRKSGNRFSEEIMLKQRDKTMIRFDLIGSWSSRSKMQIRNDDLLLIIDVQNDFCPGGALAVADGDAVVPVINRLAERFDHVVLTQDWHPSGHSSFVTSHPGASPFDSVAMPYGEQTLWPDHCVQGTAGAAFHPELVIDRAERIIRKVLSRQMKSYS